MHFKPVTATLFMSILFFLNGCISQDKISNTALLENRSVAALETESLENNFMLIFNSQQSSDYTIQKIDYLFIILIKTNLFIQDFENLLDLKIKNKKDFPNQSFQDPLKSEEYKKLLKAWTLKEKYEHEIIYLYSRVLDLRTDLSQTEVTRSKARQIYKAINNHIKSSEELKRVEFQSLMNELKNEYRNHVIEYKKALRIQALNNKALQNISAISEVPEFDYLITKNPANLDKISKLLNTKDKNLAVINNPRYSKYSLDIENEFSAMGDYTFDDRQPQSTSNVVICADGHKLCPSVDENGNIIGKIFPKGVWAFTYDDGPAVQSTSDILDLFISYKDKINPKGKATFFWTAEQVLKNEKWVKKALDNGFTVENHSYSHKNIPKQDYAEQVKQISTSNTIIETAARKIQPNYKIKFFRCPYGSCYAPRSLAVRQMIVDQNQIHAYWRIDSLDWKLLNSEKVADLVIKQMQLLDHGVILMHDVHPTTVGATRLILNWLKDQNNNKSANFKLVTVSEAVDLVNNAP